MNDYGTRHRRSGRRAAPVDRRQRPLTLSVLLLLFAAGSGLAQSPPERGRTDLRLVDLRPLVAERNESIQMKVLEVEIGRKTYEAERGIFEPAVIATLDHLDSQRPNNTQQTANLGLLATTQLNERNTLYYGGLEFLTPSGARLRTGYTLRDLSNNLQAGRGNEYESFIGASLTQPLLKNFGPGPTLARIRLAALASEIAFQEYRRQMMVSLAQAESFYWDLYLTQEQQRLSVESVATSEKVLRDSRDRAQVGKAAELEVLQAQAGVSFRQARLNDARQRAIEAATRLGSFYSYVASGTNQLPRAVDQPHIESETNALPDLYLTAFNQNPDFLVRRNQVEQENIRVAYTKNQRLPQLDLKASYGLNGLGPSPADSWGDIRETDYPAWSVGLEMRVPITGGIKERREHEAARLGKERALLGLKEIEVQVFNALDASQQKVQLYRESVGNYQAVAEFNAKVLEAQLAQLAVGSLDNRTVLETEERLFQARVAVVESLVLYRKARLELELVSGILLDARHLETTRDELRVRTETWFASRQQDRARWHALEKRAVHDVESALAAWK